MLADDMPLHETHSAGSLQLLAEDPGRPPHVPSTCAGHDFRPRAV